MAFPTSSLAARYEARLQAPVADATALSTIADHSGLARNLSQADASKRLLYRTAALNGNPAYEADAVDDWASVTVSGVNTTAQTLSVVAKYVGGASAVRVWPMMVMNAGGTRILAPYRRTGTTSAWWGFFRTSSTVELDSGLTSTNWSVVTLVRDGTTSSLYIDGTLITSGAHTGTLLYDTIQFGGRSGTTDSFGGQIALGAAWDKALDSTERAALHSYVQDTYGITVADYTGGGGTPVATVTDNARSEPRSTVALLTQNTDLATDAARSESRADDVAVSQDTDLIVNDARSASSATVPALAAEGVVITRRARSASRSDVVLLAQHTPLATDDARAESSATVPLVAQSFVIVTDDARAESTATAPTLTHLSLLDVMGARAPSRATRVVMPGTVYPTAPASRTYVVPAESRTLIA